MKSKKKDIKKLIDEICVDCPCCDFCEEYDDYGNGGKKRNKFSGVGICKISKEETFASDGCDDFSCAVCRNKGCDEEKIEQE